MKEYMKMTVEERDAAMIKAGINPKDLWGAGSIRRDKVLELLSGDAPAIAQMWKIDWGNFLVNTPQSIVNYCKAEAKRHPIDIAGICPVCGGKIEYTGDDIKTCGGGMHPWACRDCGATGEEGYHEIFDGHHYNVRRRTGNSLPPDEAG